MGLQTRINSEVTRNTAITDVMALDVTKEWVMTLRPYKRDRSVEINAVSHGWYGMIAATLREDPAYKVKGFCKLHFGIPILRTDAEFCEMYDRIFKKMDYPTKLEIMSTPGLFDVTSMMKVDQMSLYMSDMQQHYAERGVQLVYPNEPPS